jgi:Glycosyltransferase family 87
VRPLSLAACGLLVEIGWLAIWPLCGTLSHSAQFTSALLQMHPLVHVVFQLTLKAARVVLPGLPDVPLADPLGSSSYVEPAIALAVVMLWLTAMYVLALIVLDRGLGAHRSAVWIVVAGAVAFQLTLLYLPGLFSQDVFGYIAYGRLAAVYDLNPYVWPPSVLRDPVVPWVADVWRTYATPYGPVWVSVQWFVGRLSNGLSISDQALVYRLVANGLLLANLALAWRLLGRLVPLSPTQRTTALAALAWNPLVLFEIAGNAHNDVLMVSFSLLGLLLFRASSRGVLSSAAFALGTLVKYLSGLGLLWLTLASAAGITGWSRRGRRVIAIALVAAGIAVLTAAPWLELPDSLDPLLNETAGAGYVNSLPGLLAGMIADRISAPIDAARGVERVLVWTIFVIYLVWESRRVWCDPGRGTVARALARSCLVYVLLVSTSVQTWYLCLPISIAVALGWRRRLTLITLAYGALALPALYLSYYLREATPAWVYLVYGLGPLAIFARDLPAWARARTHEPRRESVGAHDQRTGRRQVAQTIMEEVHR